MSIDIRAVTGDTFPDWLRALETGFLGEPRQLGPEEAAVRGWDMDFDRVQGAFDKDRCVATFRTIPLGLTVPGGAVVPSSGVSAVTVTPTHRRRGLLTRMMTNALDAAVERGDACATLIASEYPIYGRFGFGPATWSADYEVEVHRSGLDRHHAGPANGEGGIELVDPAEVRRLGPELHERFRVDAHRQGAISRNERHWARATGQMRYEGDSHEPPYWALYRDPAGVPQGLAAYTVRSHWEAKVPCGSATVKSLFGTTPSAEHALWRYVLALDWVATVRSGPLAPDTSLPLLLPDPRAARLATYADFLWLRPLDVPRLLEARTYATTGSLVLEVTDRKGPAEGRYKLDVAPDGASCVRTTATADLVLDVGELATLYLGDESASRLLALGRVDEVSTGAAARADLLLRTANRPWCPDSF
ncbi:GNAT family N-acetyltransferase [Streptomyces oceani]|uniref:N-acetyltransferase domain-containing protein n=1 Tax=Streptomyces oceani TaxID=1075402 RepID=A0A1E7JF44_9ACTN|nr:GNAT family N-acetyltransferase [Streptomyces oceani]OEU85087.1 hypothetical protein AN216_26260 [Streptomyces oceani]